LLDMRAKIKTATFFLALIFLLGSGLSSPPQNSTQDFSTDFKFDSSDIVVTRQNESVKLATQIDFEKSEVKISISAGKETQTPKFHSGVSTVQFLSSVAATEDLTIEISRPARASDLKSLVVGSDASLPLGSLEFNQVEVIPANPRSGSDLAYASGLPDRTFLRYLTFIPMQWVSAPWAVCTDTNDSRAQYFEGDNRSWDPDSPSYRTSFSVGINWPNNGNVTNAKSVGQTRRYAFTNNSYHLIDTATAATSSMKIRVDRADTSVVAFEFWQRVANPMCDPLATLGISFDYFVAVERSGTYSAQGVSIAVPNHEFYIIDSGDPSWHPIMRRTYNTFDCLNFLNKLEPYCSDYGDFLGTR
jgi:hypothetical protein